MSFPTESVPFKETSSKSHTEVLFTFHVESPNYRDYTILYIY